MVRFLLLSSLTFFTISMTSVESHGGLVSPRSRNQVAREEGTNGAQSGVPKKEYCWHCLNRNNGMCGKIDGNDYDAWLDSTGKPMPWKPQATYQRGQVITVKAEIPANHWGHMELRACPKGRQSTQGCLDSYPLEFVQDVSYGTPKDPSYPERGYLVDRKINYTMKFRLPSNLVGEQVLLQWHYVTSNSCLPPGYADFFRSLSNKLGHSNLQMRTCSLPYSKNGFGHPEQFWNCAEISVLDGSSVSSPPPPVAAPVRAPVVAPVRAAPIPAPVKAPVAAPVRAPVAAPVKPPVASATGSLGEGCCSYDFKTCIVSNYWCGTTEADCRQCDWDVFWLPNGGLGDDVCVPRYQNCNNRACCPGLICEQKNAYYSQCVAP